MMRVAVLGTGKMARDLGAFYLDRGCELVVAATDPARLEGLHAELSRRHRRLARIAPGTAAATPPQKVLLGADPPVAVDVALETTAESPAAKRAVLEAAKPLLRGAAVATNSSSILPREIRPGLVGAHHFFPAALTGVVELICDRDSDPGAAGALRALATGAGLAVIKEGEANAFAVNRLLLPLQNEALRALRAGEPAAAVDAATISPLCATGQLSLLDAIGLDVVAAAVDAYLARMPGEARSAYAELRTGLGELLALGKRGAKNGDGLACGASLPWEVRGFPARSEALAARMRAVHANACARAVEAGELRGDEVDLALDRVFGAAVPLEAALARARGEGAARLLAAAYAAERLDYLRPSALLSR